MTSTTVPHPNPDPATVLADIRRRVAAGTLRLTAEMLQILGATMVIEARLAAAEAVFPGITRLTDEKSAALAVYRVSRRNIPYATFTTQEAARAQGEAWLKRCPLPEGTRAGWVPENIDGYTDEDLVLFGPGPDDQSVTSIQITVLPVLADYDPDAEG
ncbi:MULTISPECIES: hypothetical protein [unclassified Streptomyces]|uniref:hypothetical protein n=1 Tax=unclassified Streptomyces TaxID=2593676 RepID=UPI001BEC0E6A|nr:MULTISPECIES: hypothetical protein [unclassified Streptomyces]MBT2406874.1 hypothetical protein [Streptomyces sp. ISL-21]MBT2613091.1 hypothetical protein [Streptomyces sp. ISL-87]